jgi:hypothetical protein
MCALADDEILAYINKYITRHDLITDEERHANTANFEIFIGSLEREIADMRRRSEVPFATESKDRYSDTVAPQVTQLTRWVAEVTADIFAYQLSGLSRIVSIARELHNYVIDTKGTIGQVTALNADLRAKLFRGRRYKSLRQRRRSLLARLNRTISRNLAPDPANAVQKEVLAAVGLFQKETNYSPPSVFDEYVAAYVRSSAELSAAVGPVADLIAAGDGQALEGALSELSMLLMRSLHVSAGPTRPVVYTALVRYVFGIAYALNPAQLTGPVDEGARFLVYCDMFAHQTVRDLVLAEAITRNFTPGLAIASLFKSKSVNMLKPMEFMTNPIDLMNYVHQVLGALGQLFGANVDEMFLSFDDTLTLFLALMSLSPPANAIGIAEYVTLWEPVQVSSLLSLTKNYFVAAVEQIQKFGREKVERQSAGNQPFKTPPTDQD